MQRGTDIFYRAPEIVISKECVGQCLVPERDRGGVASTTGWLLFPN